jgi:hypothetical protein
MDVSVPDYVVDAIRSQLQAARTLAAGQEKGYRSCAQRHGADRIVTVTTGVFVWDCVVTAPAEYL